MASDEEKELPKMEVCPYCKAGWDRIEAGYGFAGGGGIGSYYHCTKCNRIFDKTVDQDTEL